MIQRALSHSTRSCRHTCDKQKAHSKLCLWKVYYYIRTPMTTLVNLTKVCQNDFLLHCEGKRAESSTSRNRCIPFTATMFDSTVSRGFPPFVYITDVRLSNQYRPLKGILCQFCIRRTHKWKASISHLRVKRLPLGYLPWICPLPPRAYGLTNIPSAKDVSSIK